ncbi:MAG: stage V sporulation protein AC [Oscillospiraceae bacterium]
MQTYSKKAYDKMVKKASPGSPIFKNCLLAFVFGGSICTLGQAIFRLYTLWGLTVADARTGVSITLIFLSALLTALGIYDRLGKYGGAGTLVPITGFANSMVSPAMEFKSEGIVTGLGVKLFAVAGPVLVFALTSSVLYGLILYFLKLI